METFYNLLVDMSEVHLKLKSGGFTDGLHFNQKNHTISVGDTVIYDNGIIPQKLKIKGGDYIEIEEMELIHESLDKFDELNRLYKAFKSSIPSDYSRFLRCNFIAKDLDKITRKEFNEAIRREKSRVMLEAFVMFNHWEMYDDRHHYWQSPVDKKCIIYKGWGL